MRRRSLSTACLSLAFLVWSLAGRASAAPWTRTGPFLPGGGVYALVVDPFSAGTAYAAAEAGVFKTTDGGARWIRTSRGLPLSPIVALASDSSSPGRLYAFSYDQGFFRSSDGGSTWGPVGDESIPKFTSGVLVVDPRGVLFASFFGQGILKSVDHGDTWTSVNIGLDSLYVGSIAIAPNTPGTLYAASDTGTYQTNSAGARWFRTSTTVFSTLVVDPRSPQVVYGLSSLGVFRSSNGGATWQPRNTGLPPDTSAVALAFDPLSSATQFLLSSHSIFRSSDGGEHWIDQGTGIEASDLCPRAIVPSPRPPFELYLGNQCSGGVFKSLDAAESWERTADEFATPNINVVISDRNGDATLVGTSDGLFRASADDADGGAIRAGLDDVDIVTLTQAPSDPSTLYAGDPSGRIYRTTDGAHSWGLVAAPSYWPRTSLVVDPASSSTVYAAENNVLVRSTDSGQTWGDVWTFGSGEFPVLALVFAGSELILGTSAGEIWKSDDGGTTWRLLLELPLYDAISAIVADPRAPTTLYASWIYSGAAPGGFTPPGGVYKSTDAGTSWQPVQSGLGVSVLAINPGRPDVVYAGVVRGQVLRSVDAGSQWHPLGDGLMDGWISGLTINPSRPSVLYAGLSGALGSGVFVFQENDRRLSGLVDSDRRPRVASRPH